MGLYSAAWYPALLPSSACWGLWSLLAKDVKMHHVYIANPWCLAQRGHYRAAGISSVSHALLPCSPACPGHTWDSLLLTSLAYRVHAACMAL